MLQYLKWFCTSTVQGSSSWGNQGKVVWLPARGDRLLSLANSLEIFLAANALSDAFSIWLAGPQDSSPRFLLGKVADT